MSSSSGISGRGKLRLKNVQFDIVFVLLVAFFQFFLILDIGPRVVRRKLCPAQMCEILTFTGVPPVRNPAAMAFGEPYGFGLPPPDMSNPFGIKEGIAPSIPADRKDFAGTASGGTSAVTPFGWEPIPAPLLRVFDKKPLCVKLPSGVRCDAGDFGNRLKFPNIDKTLAELGWQSGNLKMLVFFDASGRPENICFMPSSFAPDAVRRIEKELTAGMRLVPAGSGAGKISVSWCLADNAQAGQEQKEFKSMTETDNSNEKTEILRD